MQIIIIGGGNSVYYLSRSLISKGHNITIINHNHAECIRLARKLKAKVIFGDASDRAILEQAGASSADALFTITLNDHDNLVICQIASLTFKIPKIFTVVDDPDNETVFSQLGIQNVLSINRILAAMIEEKTGFSDITNLFSIAEGKVNFTELELQPDSPVINQPLAEIQLPESAIITVIIRNNEPVIPRGSTILRVGDRLVVMNTPIDHSKIIRQLTGEK